VTDDIDPEVLADLRLRASTEYDRSRTRDANYDWKRPADVAQWRCRRCGCDVGVTQDAVDRFEDCNRILARMGEAPITTSIVVACEPCRVIVADAVQKRNARVCASTKEIIQQLKAGMTANIRIVRHNGEARADKREALQQLEQWGHPDVRGLEAWLEEQNLKSSGRRSRKAGV
jgi:hypothetical protein